MRTCFVYFDCALLLLLYPLQSGCCWSCGAEFVAVISAQLRRHVVHLKCSSSSLILPYSHAQPRDPRQHFWHVSGSFAHCARIKFKVVKHAEYKNIGASDGAECTMLCSLNMAIYLNKVGYYLQNIWGAKEDI